MNVSLTGQGLTTPINLVQDGDDEDDEKNIYQSYKCDL